MSRTSEDCKMCLRTVADPDLQIREVPGHPDPDIRGGGPVSKKKTFSALQASVWSKNNGGRAPRAPPLDSPLKNVEKFLMGVEPMIFCY